MKNIMITIEYDGSCYHGWQIQPRDITIQEVIQKALLKITGEKVSLLASGRTDTGVHALAQAANFFSSTHLPPESIQKGLNSILPRDITITNACEVPLKFNSRFSAKKKHYRYIILNRSYRSSFDYRYACFIPYPLNVDNMISGAKYLVGEKDFTSFCAGSSDSFSKVRKIFSFHIEKKGDYIECNIVGSGFLKYMVRTIMGTIIQLGREKLNATDIDLILKKKDRKCAGVTAPPGGLYLVSVEYDPIHFLDGK